MNPRWTSGVPVAPLFHLVQTPLSIVALLTQCPTILQSIYFLMSLWSTELQFVFPDFSDQISLSLWGWIRALRFPWREKCGRKMASWWEEARKEEIGKRSVASTVHREWVIQATRAAKTQPQPLLLVTPLLHCPSCCPPTVFLSPGAPHICFLLISLRVADKAVLL